MVTVQTDAEVLKMSELDYLPYKATENQIRQSARTKISVFIAFYNNLHFLEMILASLSVQSFQDFEVVICDDGSKAEVVGQIQSKLETYSFPILHLWQADDGFRKNELLNKGIIEAKGDYIVFLDQDCICHPKFLEDHVRFQQPGLILTGRRVELNQFVSSKLNAEKIEKGFIQKNFWWIFFAISLMKDNNNFKGLRFASKLAQRLLNRKSRGVVGCNFSAFKSDLLRVNGFDSRYRFPGTGEDSDIEWRMHQLGMQTKPLIHLALQYHVYHKLQRRSSKNDALFLQTRQEKNVVTKFGVSQILELKLNK